MARAPSLRQKRVAKLLIDNTRLDKPLTDREIVAASGFGRSMSKNSHVVTKSEGVQQALKDYGFSEENAMMVVSEIMLNGDVDASARLKATDQVFKVRGSYAPERSATTNLNVTVDLEKKDKESLLSLLNDKGSAS